MNAYENLYGATTATGMAESQPVESKASALRGALTRNIEFARELAGRAERVADLLVGPVPGESGVKDGGQRSGPDCFLYELSLGEGAVYLALCRIHDALARMENDLG